MIGIQVVIYVYYNTGIENSAPLRVSGIAKLCLELGGQQYHVEMVVADLRTEEILGLDFLETNPMCHRSASGHDETEGKRPTNPFVQDWKCNTSNGGCECSIA